ncbi:outer membrane beta-barrel family protein [Changchengzhania lutea]|uniref:outer membrane beta-barrel family protein n=1 Tax=Changchengzhania lutea TaxID=2049305 RepID=UPI00115EF053|nr:outer membrane beta-barrel family protein [Changchengzhania lutea]
MKRITLTILLITFVSLFASGKTNELKNRTIKGTVLDKETKLPLEYATVSFYSYSEQKIVDGIITDGEGKFEIKITDGIYDIKIEYISYTSFEIKNKKIDSNLDLGVVYLDLDVEALGEVEIIAERTTVEIKLDKRIYNVGKDLTVRGGTVSDVLDNVPSVAVDAEGNVSLRGNDDVRILINGKPSGLVGLNSAEALQQLPAEAIERVEVITSPSARYQAEGTAGILNIILRRSKLLGLNGAITANVGHPDAAGISGNLNFRTGNVNIFNTTSYRYNESIGNWDTFTEFKNSGNFAKENRDWTDTRKGLTNNIGIEWYINESTSITTALVYNDGSNNRRSTNVLTQLDPNQSITSESLRLDPMEGDNKTIQYSFNFNKDFDESGHKLSFDFQYENNEENESSLINSGGINTDFLSDNDKKTQILLQTDYVKPLGENSQLEFGYRGDFSETATDYRVELLNPETNVFEVDRNLTNFLNFRNNIHSAYTQFGSKINKFSYLLGLRLENTQLTIDQPTSGDFQKNSYTGLFPTVNINYEVNQSESYSLGFNRRISRPRSFFLNPFPSRSSLTNIFQGDPSLIPTYSSKVDLGYLKRFEKVTFSSSLYYQYSTNIIRFVSNDTGDTVDIDGENVPVIVRGPANVGKETRYGFEFNLTYSPSKKWRMNTDFNIFNSEVDGDFNGQNFDSENLRYTIRFSNKLTLPARIDWQTNLNYRGPSQDAQNNRDGIFTADLAFSKDLFKDKASLSFNVRDLLNSRRFTGTVETEDFITERDIQFRGGRTYNLSFTYRFNQKKKQQRSGFGGGGDIEM